MVLKMNDFQFKGVNFLQVGGTAMGTKVAPSYAVNFMGDFNINIQTTTPVVSQIH